MFDYIEMFYNPKRKHAHNGMLSPIEFERQQKLNNQGVQETRGYSLGTFRFSRIIGVCSGGRVELGVIKPQSHGALYKMPWSRDLAGSISGNNMKTKWLELWQ